MGQKAQEVFKSMAHLTRYYMYKRIKECFKEPINGKILGISGIENFRPLISKDAKVLDVHYPEVDMQSLPYEDNSFDFVISDQVIEHLENQKSDRRVLSSFKKGRNSDTYHMLYKLYPLLSKRLLAFFT